MSPIDTWDGATVIFTFGHQHIGVWIFLFLALAMFIGFFVRMIQHENHAYAEIEAHEPIEHGPAIEGEPPAF